MMRDLNGVIDRDQRRDEILLAYLEAHQAGQVLDRAALLEANPGFRDELEEFFATHDQMERLAVGLREICESPRAVRMEQSPHGDEEVFPSDCGQVPRLLEAQPQNVQSDPTSEIGRLGDFRLLREVGRGGMGVVYEAEQVSLRRRVALKMLPFAAALDCRQLQRFKNEALAAAHLRHENIVPVYAVGEDRGVHYYAMQFIEGRSLAALISELKSPFAAAKTVHPVANPQSTMGTTSQPAVLSTERSTGSRKYYDWVASLGRQAALALDYAHSVGIVHRDVKPANLLLDPHGQLWVTDFGLAQVAGDAGLTITGELLGTLRYASPEQVLGRRGVVDHRSDVYSLGATIYELLTLGPIFGGRDRNELLRQIVQDEPTPPRSVHASVPKELETIVLKALCKEPSERYGTSRELADDLQRFRDNRPVLARRPGMGERLRKLARRHPSFVVASLVVLIVLSVGSLLSTLLIRNEQQRTKIEQKNVQEAYRRERQRAEEAQARFWLARRSVDEMFRISQEELADRPGLEGLRKRMLWSVLAYYQEFLDDRRNDEEDRADLVETKQRVETILADLSVLRAASQLYLLAQPPVLDALQLDDDQRPGVNEFCTRVGKEWMESFNEVGRLSPTERGRRAIERARIYEANINGLLRESQKSRLRQIGLQAQGPGAFREPEVVAELALTGQQREQFRMIEEESLVAWMRRSRQGALGGESSSPTAKLLEQRIAEVLTEEQAKHWRAMTGEPLPAAIMPFASPAVPFGGIGPKTPLQ